MSSMSSLSRGTKGHPTRLLSRKGNKAVVSGFFSLYAYDPSCGYSCYDENGFSFGPQSIAIK